MIILELVPPNPGARFTTLGAAELGLGFCLEFINAPSPRFKY